MAGTMPPNFGEHRLALLTDPIYRRSKGLSPLPEAPAPDAAPTIPETGEPVIEVDPELLRQLDSWKKERDEHKRRVEELTVLIDKAEAELVLQFTAAAVPELVLDGRRATVGSQLWLKKRDETVTPAAVAAALRADGVPELVTPEGWNASRLSAWARELEREGKPLPPNVGKLLEGRETWNIKFTSPRPSRARQRQAGGRSSILDSAGSGASSDATTRAKGS